MTRLRMQTRWVWSYLSSIVLFFTHQVLVSRLQAARDELQQFTPSQQVQPVAEGGTNRPLHYPQAESKSSAGYPHYPQGDSYGHSLPSLGGNALPIQQQRPAHISAHGNTRPHTPAHPGHHQQLQQTSDPTQLEEMNEQMKTSNRVGVVIF